MIGPILVAFGTAIVQHPWACAGGIVALGGLGRWRAGRKEGVMAQTPTPADPTGRKVGVMARAPRPTTQAEAEALCAQAEEAIARALESHGRGPHMEGLQDILHRAEAVSAILWYRDNPSAAKIAARNGCAEAQAARAQ